MLCRFNTRNCFVTLVVFCKNPSLIVGRFAFIRVIRGLPEALSTLTAKKLGDNVRGVLYYQP